MSDFWDTLAETIINIAAGVAIFVMIACVVFMILAWPVFGQPVPTLTLILTVAVFGPLYWAVWRSP